MRVRTVANRVSRKLLYLETDHAFVDLLLCFLQLPLAFIFDLFSIKDSCLPQVGCISNAYQSLCTLMRKPPLQEEAPGLSYIVTDDLTIVRVSNTMENLELLSNLKVTNMANLNKLETSITVEEATELLKCSFISKTALNMVFGWKVNNSKAPESMLSWNQIVKVSSTSMSVRFLVKRHARKIVYMEAGKDFVDMLERFLNTPIAWLMNKSFNRSDNDMGINAGSIHNIYLSVFKLSKDMLLVPKEDMMNPTFKKTVTSPSILISLLRAAAPVVYTCSRVHGVSFLCNDKCPSCKDAMTFELNVLDSGVLPAMGRNVYKCNKSTKRCPIVSYVRSKWCTFCGELTNREIPLVLGGSANWTLEPPQAFQGYVKKNLSFIVTDDLNILPASSINNIAMLNKLKIFRMGNIHSFEVSITINEALELLKASFTSGEALNTVFGEQTDRSTPKASRFDCECLDFILHWWNS